MIPVSQVSLAFKDGLTKTNMALAENDILPMFQKIKGVSSVALFGKTAPQIEIQADQEKLAEKQLPFQAVLGAVQGRNFAGSIGESTLDGKASAIKVSGTLNDLDTLKKIELAPGVKLEDVAKVDVKQDQQSVSHVAGKDSLFLIVTKSAGANAVAVSEAVNKLIEEVNAKYTNAETKLFMSSADGIVSSVNSMMREVLLGALFATVIILLFLRNVRSTLVTIISIPLSLGLTLFLLSKSGVTLNILTLGGVAVAVGRLVDDSIVVIENIFRRSQKEKLTKELVIDATREVATAITSSTLTTVAVFLPIGLLSGSLQDFMLPFALTVTYSLLASLLVALTVVPVFSALLLKNAKLPEHKQPVRYLKLLTWSLNRKWLPLGVSLLVFLGSIGAYMTMPKGAVEGGGSGMTTVTLSYPPETPEDQVKAKAQELEAFINAQPEVKIEAMQIGNSADAAKYGQVVPETEAQFTIVMKKDADLNNFKTQVKSQKANYPGAELIADDYSFTGGSTSTVSIDILGDKPGDLTSVAQSVTKAVQEVKGVEKVLSNQEKTKPAYKIVVDSKIADAQSVAMSLHPLIHATPIGTMTLDSEQTTIVLKPMFDPRTSGDLAKLPIFMQAGVVELSKIAAIEQTNETSSVLHKDGHLYVRVTAQVDPTNLSVIGTDIQKKIDELKLPEGVTLQTGGAAQQQADDFTDLFTTMAAALGFVYLIMVITFKSLRGPLAIICSLPLAAIGAVVGLLVMQVSPDFTAIFGALMLIGIVVTNAIVLIDRIKQNEDKNMTIRDAIVEAAATRLRPILMTAVATICAMAPLLFAETESGSIVSKSLAIVVIGGLAAATLLTLVIVPVIYELLHFRKAARQRKKMAKQAGTAM
jgi:HAE1 family hydrophobic/amphiphilic exporter-1